ncbi:MAG: bifunctional DNA-formamidopyrimidine glycosylase/DNA-(apurinic or apyrimidinic site) lyase [Pseudomonadota bacterium]|nr:bifunctional DNA-formamidopyrimidine glycosylase/DNA-(apurinic or apyrimidinic site) lyase [Pseudomonadota bacterium]
MPELPEVETTLRGVRPYVVGQVIKTVVVRQRHLRVPVTHGLESRLQNQVVRSVGRRAKYLLFQFDFGTLSVHLGMSGRLRVVPVDLPPEKHDHFELVFEHGVCLRLRDPRRFGQVLWLGTRPLESKWLKHLGPEPLDPDFNGDYLYRQARSRKVAVKNFIMDGRIVVGVGNIYASEALYLAGIHPSRAAGRISLKRYHQLCTSIEQVLRAAIKAGGTTLRDYMSIDGRAGYFEQELHMYGREGFPCPHCGTTIKRRIIGQRSTFYCATCQR